jgi:GDP-mannose 6-dehydrogenase
VVGLRIVIVGLGYVGVTAAGCLSELGHQVCGVDVNSTKVDRLRRGECPIEEPGLPDLIRRAVDAGLLTASHELPDMSEVDLAIVCVGTPGAPDGSHNMAFVAEATRQLAEAIAESRDARVAVAYRSTFRPGTMEELVAPIFAEVVGHDFADRVELVYNPEFLRESTAVADFMHPPKVVIGTQKGDGSQVLEQLHSGFDAPVIKVGLREAELTKFVDNTWHAVKVTFANEIGRVCDGLGVSASVVHEIFVSDTKLNISPAYLRPGGPFGGSCLPKDVRALQVMAGRLGAQATLIDSVIASNEAHKAFQLQRVVDATTPGSTILLVGLAFKPLTDDLRESPNVDLAQALIDAGYQVSVFDPSLEAARLMGQNLGYAYSHLPGISELLIDRQVAESGEFDLVVLATGPVDQLTFGDTPTLDISRIP